MGLVAVSVERNFGRRDRFAIGRRLGQSKGAGAFGVENAAVHLDVCGESASCGDLLAGKFGEFAHIELRRVKLQLNGT